MIRVLAPAKVNLGLEVLGKRPDGFHEIRTILCAVSILDSLDFVDDGAGRLSVDDPVLRDDNLVARALKLASVAVEAKSTTSVFIRKRIPVAAGLGGASTDAAAALLALRKMHPNDLDSCALHDMASRLGSDVPFFLAAGLALASGRGGSLDRLPYQRVDVVIVKPDISISAKTATMYGSLEPRDFSDGEAVERLAKSLERGQPLDPETTLPNAFVRPLYAMHSALIDLAARIGRISALPVQLSGAGPAHFVICRDLEHRQWLRNQLRSGLYTTGVRVLSARSVPLILLRES